MIQPWCVQGTWSGCGTGTEAAEALQRQRTLSLRHSTEEKSPRWSTGFQQLLLTAPRFSAHLSIRSQCSASRTDEANSTRHLPAALNLHGSHRVETCYSHKRLAKILEWISRSRCKRLRILPEPSEHQADTDAEDAGPHRAGITQ